MQARSYVIAVHGGAGTITGPSADEPPYHQGLERALRAGAEILNAAGSALDAVQAAVACLEDDPLFNAGRGSVYTSAQTHEMDAGIMDGATLAAGAVTGVTSVRNPVVLARAVLHEGGPVLLAAAGAQAFAARRGFAQMPPDYFHTQQRLAQLRRVRKEAPGIVMLDHDAARLAGDHSPLDDSGDTGTVGAVALDLNGNLAAAVSTGGMTNKPPGRVGDSPIVGAGFYANNTSCAASATGSGEHIMRAALCHDIHARMHYLGETLERAAHDAVWLSLTRVAGEGGVIAVDRAGHVAMPFNTKGMYRGYLRQGQAARTFIYAEEAERG